MRNLSQLTPRVGIGLLLTVLLGSGQLSNAQETSPSVMRVGPGDVLEVSVLGIEELSRRVRVLGDGTITLPLLGNFQVAGFSVKGVENLIARMLTERQLVNDPQVSIFVAESVLTIWLGAGLSWRSSVRPVGSPRTAVQRF